MGYARGEDNLYALTPKVLALGYAYLSSVRLTDVARPIMESLTDDLCIGTSLAALDGAEIVYVDRVQRQRVTSINLAVGTRLPAHATSMGHVLLADLTPAELEQYLAGRSPRQKPCVPDSNSSGSAAGTPSTRNSSSAGAPPPPPLPTVTAGS